MRFDGGWVKLHRSIFTSDIQGDSSAILIFMLLISWANVKNGRYKGKPILRGQLVTGTRQIAEALKLGIGTVHRKILMLEKYGMLERKKTHWGSVLTICNYCKFQDSENEVGTQNDSMVERRWNAGGTPVERKWNHNEELKNSKREEGEKETNSCVPLSVDEPVSKKKALVPIEDPAILAIASNWYKFAQQEMPWKKEGGEWCLQGFARSLVKVAKATDLNQAGVEALFKFIENDEFWRKNAVSPNGLLTKSKNGSRKIDNILNRMKPPEDLVKKALLEYANSEEPIENPFDKWARDVREKRRS